MIQRLNLNTKVLRVGKTLLGLGAQVARFPQEKGRKRDAAVQRTGEWLASELVNLGPTYIKVGQFISTRNDMYGDVFSKCFTSLHSDIEPLRGAAARKLIDSDSGIDTTLFSYIDYDNAVAASMAQVHRARMADTGMRVMIKVLRSGIREEIASDMVFLGGILAILEAAMKPSDPIVRQLKTTITDMGIYLDEEMDVYGEIHNLCEFGKLYPVDHPGVRVPRVLQYASSPRAIVMEEVPSMSMESLGANYRTPKALASRIMSTFILQMLDVGILHGDPHRGNLGLHADGRLVIYDFGSVVRIAPSDVHFIKQMIMSVAMGDMKGAVRTLEHMGAEVTDVDQLCGYISDYRSYVRTLDMPALINATSTRTKMAMKDSATPPELPIVLPPRISRILRTFSLLEGVCKSIDPEFSYYDAVTVVASSHEFFDAGFVDYKRRRDMDTVIDWIIGRM